jgi:hypothetical protein
VGGGINVALSQKRGLIMAQVINLQNGKCRRVKNLRWLVNHARKINRVVWVWNDEKLPEGKLVAHLHDNLVYVCDFGSKQVFDSWLKQSRTMPKIYSESSFTGRVSLLYNANELTENHKGEK